MSLPRTVQLALIAICIKIIWISNAIADNAIPDVDNLKTQAIQLELHSSLVWTQLLHYQPSTRSASGIESQIDDSRFFNAADGKTNPLAELLATIEAVFAGNEKIDQQESLLHPRCRFVSREAWLRKQLNQPSASVPEFCTHYREWREAIGSDSMSLVFPASYLNSPSSMFGHTLLRLDPANIDSGSDWLSWSLNFAADTGNENFSAGYAFKGIAGGYAGKFNSVPYFKKLQEYGAIENRDIWEYQLDFTPIELDRMLDHAWELRDINFDYYFFRQNCSYRLLELMDYARPSLQLTQQFKLTTIPADTIKAVYQSGIVKKTQYRASLGTGIQARYNELPKQLRHWVTAISANPDKAADVSFNALSNTHRASVLRVANDLLTYQSRRSSRSDTVAEKRLKLLKLISALPVEEFSPPRPTAPELAHDTRVITASIGQRESTKYMDLGFRWSYHDLLDRNIGYLKGAGITLGDFRLRQYEQGASELQALGLVKLQSISDRALIFNALSWNLSVGLLRNPTRNDNRLAGVFDGSIGKSTTIARGTIGYALLGGAINQYGKLSENYVDVRVELGLLHYHRAFASQLEFEIESAQDESLRRITSFSTNVPLAKNQALRFSVKSSNVENDSATNASLEYRFYF